MNPLSATYGAVVGLRNSLYDRGTFRAQRLQRPVVSIGNISVGGTGKTPFAIMLGELLKQRGIGFDVLSRGYRRSTTGVRVVEPGGNPQDSGDEPLLIARRLGVPVIVGERRYDAGAFAETEFNTQLHLLDDGFQHRQLARDLDIVILAPEDLRSGLLPTGRLREPPSSLARAHVIVVDESLDNAALRLRPDQHIWKYRRGLRLDTPRSDPLAFCGIAKPDRFFSQLRAQGVKVSTEISFRDHHRYSEADIRRLIQSARNSGANGFITTAKDHINLGGHAKMLEPLIVAEVTMELAQPEAAVELIVRRCGIRLPA